MPVLRLKGAQKKCNEKDMVSRYSGKLEFFQQHRGQKKVIKVLNLDHGLTISRKKSF